TVMKHTWILSYVLAAGVAGFGALAPRPAAAASPAGEDADKKPAPQSRIPNEEYRLGGGDKLRIEIYKDPQLSQSLQVRPDAKNIRILRKAPTCLQTITFNYKDAVKSARAPLYLRPGDTVVVPD